MDILFKVYAPHHDWHPFYTGCIQSSLSLSSSSFPPYSSSSSAWFSHIFSLHIVHYQHMGTLLFYTLSYNQQSHANSLRIDSGAGFPLIQSMTSPGWPAHLPHHCFPCTHFYWQDYGSQDLTPLQWRHWYLWCKKTHKEHRHLRHHMGTWLHGLHEEQDSVSAS